jgi:hypothetical protein
MYKISFSLVPPDEKLVKMEMEVNPCNVTNIFKKSNNRNYYFNKKRSSSGARTQGFEHAGQELYLPLNYTFSP